MKAVAIIQARMGSTRLPGKCMLPLAHRTALWWCANRCLWADLPVCVATTHNPADLFIANYCRKLWGNRIKVFRGSEEDVLGRTLQAAHFMGADIIVDVTSDCPLVDHEHIRECLQAVEFGADYASNINPRQWPDGLDVQAYTTDELRNASTWAETNRENSGWNIQRRALSATIDTYYLKAPPEERMPEVRLTLDTPEDHAVIEECLLAMEAEYGGNFGAPEICRWWKENKG